MDNRRRHARIGLALAAEIEVNGEVFEGETRDLSEGGVAVILGASLDENSTIALSLILTEDGIADADEDPFECRAKVIWVAPGDDGQTTLGLRFLEVSGEERARLRRFLTALK